MAANSLLFRAFVLIAAATSLAECGRLLIAAPFGSKSHQNSYISLVKELSKRGHHVTLITNYKVSDFTKLKDVDQVLVESLQIDPSFFGDAFEQAVSGGGISAVVSQLGKLFEYPVKVTETTYAEPAFRELLKTGKFDLVLVSQFFGAGMVPLAWHFNATLGAFSPGPLFPGLADALGDSEHTEYIPGASTENSDIMTLPQRIGNTVSITVFSYIFKNWHVNNIQKLVSEVFPGAPLVTELEKNTSLVLTNSHPIFSYPRALPPVVVEVGGMHCRPGQPLPPKLEEFVNHEAGFIIFAVGSAIPMHKMPVELVDAFVNVFEKLPQRVIWQWRGKQRASYPKNVMAIDWLPQQDLLGHKNCRLFLTHGGLNSLQEAVYHGVPLMGLPFGSDQNQNLARAEREGYAIQLKWKDVNQESIARTINELVNNPKYEEAVSKLSMMLQEQPQTPLERAVYWVEFNMKHKSSSVFRLGSRYLAPYQRALVDVYAILMVVFSLPILLFVFIVKRCCFSSKKAVDSTKKNK